MARINKSAGVASRPNPGIWKAMIPDQFEKGGEQLDGVITTNDSGDLLRDKNGDEMWKLRCVIVDEHPKAPRDVVVFANISFGGKSAAKTNALFKAVGAYDGLGEDDDVMPAHIQNKPFALVTEIGDKGYLETSGFACFMNASEAPVLHKRGGGAVPGAAAAATATPKLPF